MTHINENITPAHIGGRAPTPEELAQMWRRVRELEKEIADLAETIASYRAPDEGDHGEALELPDWITARDLALKLGLTHSDLPVAEHFSVVQKLGVKLARYCRSHGYPVERNGTGKQSSAMFSRAAVVAWLEDRQEGTQSQ